MLQHWSVLTVHFHPDSVTGKKINVYQQRAARYSHIIFFGYLLRFISFAVCAVELWSLSWKQSPCRAPCSFRRLRKGTETPQRWRWVKSCCHVMPTIVESLVSVSCWSGWTPQPACLVGKTRGHSQYCQLKLFYSTHCNLWFKNSNTWPRRL